MLLHFVDNHANKESVKRNEFKDFEILKLIFSDLFRNDTFCSLVVDILLVRVLLNNIYKYIFTCYQIRTILDWSLQTRVIVPCKCHEIQLQLCPFDIH